MVFRKKLTPTPSLNYDAYDKDWYFVFLRQWLKRLSDTRSNTPELQGAFLDELALRIKANSNNRDLKLLNASEIKIFWEGVSDNLKLVDESVIIDHTGHYNPPLKDFLLSLKGSELHITYSSDDIVLKTADGVVFAQASNRDVFIEMMSYERERNALVIMGCITFPFDQKEVELVAIVNGKRQVLRDSGVYSDYKIFGEVAYHKFPFRIDINLSKAFPLSLSFQLESKSKGTRVPLRLNFNTYSSRLAGRITYWLFGKYVATHNRKAIFIKRPLIMKTLVREIAFLLAIAIFWRRPRTAVLRLLYWLTKPVWGWRTIWLFADKIYKAGDNSEYLYRYAVKQRDGISKYYTLRDDSPDASRFRRDGLSYLKYKTIKQRLLFLHSSILIFTHNNAPGYYRFGGPNEVYFRGLYNYDIMYIQHGLTVQETAWLFKKSVDDFRRFFVASPFETANLLRPSYGFKPSEIIKAGAARYDGLVSNDKKNILITPTWRTYLAPPGKDFGESRDANRQFKKTDFYKIYNALITNRKLIATAKRLGYDITYLLHPVMSSQIDDFSNKGYVKIISATDDFNYEKALTTSSLMVTDYSGVQFDFAYMYKPVVYFHPPELPPSYDEAVYQYNKHALGDITTDVQQLVDLLCEYMQNDCAIKPKYRKRVDNFFYFHDRKNSKRTYEAIIRWAKLSNSKRT